VRTLCIDIGGTGVKAAVLDASGACVTGRLRVPTPHPATPDAVVGVVDALAAELGPFDRVSVGFPGVVRHGVVRTAPHLDPTWSGVDLGRRLEQSLHGKPARVVNDGTLHGLAVIAGRGLEAAITLGTGLGCCLYVDGRPWQMELGHHPCDDRGRVYEDLLGEAARLADGDARWNEHVRACLARMEALFNYDRIFVGGGNARLLERDRLPANATVIDNDAGLLGGLRLWC
jgi:polyphosphate glucokinase